MEPLKKLSAVYVAAAGAYAIAIVMSVHSESTKKAEREANFLVARYAAPKSVAKPVTMLRVVRRAREEDRAPSLTEPAFQPRAVPVALAATPPHGNGIDRSGAPQAAQSPASKPFPNDAPDARAIAAPGGFTAFEMHYPDEVRDGIPAVATRAQIDLARRVNASVNELITYRATKPWTIALQRPAYGDCKTYALTKRHILDGLGIPDGAFRDVVVNDALTQEFHMLLEMQSVDGVEILDSLPNDAGDRFYNAAEMPSIYTVIEYQAWGRPEQWETPGFLTSAIVPITPGFSSWHAMRIAKFSRAYPSPSATSEKRYYPLQSKFISGMRVEM